MTNGTHVTLVGTSNSSPRLHPLPTRDESRFTNHFSRRHAGACAYLVQRPPVELSTGTIPFNASSRFE
jgi:hypothetical protein